MGSGGFGGDPPPTKRFFKSPPVSLVASQIRSQMPSPRDSQFRLQRDWCEDEDEDYYLYFVTKYHTHKKQAEIFFSGDERKAVKK